MRSVGILGGMGPEATILLMQKCLSAVPAVDDADHIPLIVHQNPQVPSRIAALIDGTGPDPTPVLQSMARDLANAGAVALAMPCNTAHHYAPAIRTATDLPFLDMLDVTVTALTNTGARKIGILASPATRITGVFDAPFAAHELTPIFPPNEAKTLALIRAVKAGSKGTEVEEALASLAAQLMDQDCDHILIACTEFSLLTAGHGPQIPWTDSLDCLTRAIVDFARS
ncbi:MAG: amino acid racemase [Rhodobacterales bacterium]|nr:amino acid racemase [Rhodobacterales bacterium]